MKASGEGTPVKTEHRQRIEQAFAAACGYDHHARVQLRVARSLAERIGNLPLPNSPRILEIGCGTGFLTEALAARISGGRWLVTDISAAMVERCRRRMGARPDWRFATLDGEYGAPAGMEPFDLICSSLVLQWFDDPAAAIARMIGQLAPGGHLLFSTLTAGTFAEWRAAHMDEGLPPGTPPMLSAEALAALFPERQCDAPQVERIVEHCASARAFLRDIKAIGAATPDPAHRPLSPDGLRRIMRRFDRSDRTITYEVVTCHFQRESVL